MNAGPTSRRRTWRMLWPLVLVLALVLVVAGARALWRHPSPEQGQSITIASGSSRDGAPQSTTTRTRVARAEGPPFVTSVSPNGRYFLDQYGQPILVRGDSPWALLTKVSPQQAPSWFDSRRGLGFNAAIASLIGATVNGGPSDDGSTFDGLQPFVDGDILRWQEPYWQRATDYLRMAADHGITVFLYPIDGWTIGHAFVPGSIEQCQRYGGMVAERFKDLPNIVWMSGGDYFPATSDLATGSDVDHCIDAMMRGIRATGDNRPFSIQLGYQKSISTENPYWAQRVDWNFVYTYYPTYRAVLEAYRREPAIPAMFSEGNYEGENNQQETPPTTNETLRRQVLWSLTSGSAGDFVGSDDWEFHDGWEQRLSTTALDQTKRLRTYVSTLRWWELVPDTRNELVTEGRGTEVTTDEPKDVLDSDYVTAARTPDGRLAVIYLPTRHTIRVSSSTLASGTQATWVDPASGATRQVPMSDTFTTPGPNADGNDDWLLVLAS